MEGNDKPRIYPLENKPIDVHTHEIIIYGFLDAAELIVTNCESKKKFINLDRLLFPLLFINLSLIEFCLKIILNKLYEHKQKGCSYIVLEVKKYKTNHNINELAKDLKNTLDTINRDAIGHNIKNIDLVIHLANKLHEYHVTSMSLRYLIDKKGDELTNLHKKGLCCDYKSLHEDVKIFAKNTLNFINSYDLIFCEQKEFTPIRLIELKNCLKIMQKIKIRSRKYRKMEQLSELERIKKKILNNEDPDCFTADDVDFSLISSNHYSLDDLNTQELSLLVMGLYFKNYPLEPCFSVGYFDDWPKEDKLIKIEERILGIAESISNLKLHIKKVEKMINISEG